MNIKDLKEYEVESAPTNISDLTDYEIEESEPTEETSQLEAAVTGLAQGATLGAYKPLLAAGFATFGGKSDEEKQSEQQTKDKLYSQSSVALEKIGKRLQTEKDPQILEELTQAYENIRKQKEEVAQPESWTKKYYDAKQQLQERQEKAREEHPLTSFGTELVGGVAGLGKLGGSMQGLQLPGKIGKGVKLGAGVGAASGAIEGESKLLEGDFSGTAEDIGAGALGGAAVGGLIPVGAEVLKKAVKVPSNLPIIKEFLAGKKFTEETGEIIGRPALIARAKGEAKKIQQPLVSLKEDIGAGVTAEETRATDMARESWTKGNDLAEEIGLVPLDALEEQVLKLKQSPMPLKPDQKMARTDLIERLENTIANAKKENVPVDVGNRDEQVFAVQSPISSLFASSAKELKNALNSITQELGEKNPDAYKVNAMASKLTKEIEEAIRTGTGDNKYEILKDQYSNILAATKKLIGDKKKFSVDPNIRTAEAVNHIQKLLRSRTEGSATHKSQIIDYLKNVDKNVANDVADIFEKQSKYEDIFYGSQQGGLPSDWIQTVKLWLLRRSAQLGGLTEQAKRAMTPTGDRVNQLSKFTSDQFNKLSNKLEQNEQYKAHADAVRKLATAPENRRATLLYALTQNPAFREAVKEIDFDGFFGGEDESDSTRPY